MAHTTTQRSLSQPFQFHKHRRIIRKRKKKKFRSKKQKRRKNWDLEREGGRELRAAKSFWVRWSGAASAQRSGTISRESSPPSSTSFRPSRRRRRRRKRALTPFYPFSFDLVVVLVVPCRVPHTQHKLTKGAKQTILNARNHRFALLHCVLFRPFHMHKLFCFFSKLY